MEQQDYRTYGHGTYMHLDCTEIPELQDCILSWEEEYKVYYQPAFLQKKVDSFFKLLPVAVQNRVKPLRDLLYYGKNPTFF